MSVATTPASDHALTRRASSADRGRLVLADKVVEKVAGQAAAEVPGVLGREGGVLGVGGHATTAARPSVDVDLSRDSADIAIRAGIAYPASIRRVTAELRDHVAGRVQALTGVTVHRVDVDVTFLVADGADDAEERLR